MDQRLLKQFVNLAETLHFGRAAEASHVSSSALSRNIRQLEEQAGAALFVRDNRSVELTRAGEKFLSYARETLAQWDVIRNAMMEESGKLHGEVSIYCSVTASYSFLFELLSELRSEHPHIEIKLHTGDPEHAIKRVLAGDEDLAIGARPDALPVELAFKSIATTPLVFIASTNGTDYCRLERNKPNAAHWRDVPMILSESGLARKRADAWFGHIGIQPNIYAQVAGNEAIVSMVSLGFGVGVVPKIVLDNSPLASQVRELKVAPRLKSYDVGIFAPAKRLKSPLMNAFWSRLK